MVGLAPASVATTTPVAAMRATIPETTVRSPPTALLSLLINGAGPATVTPLGGTPVGVLAASTVAVPLGVPAVSGIGIFLGNLGLLSFDRASLTAVSPMSASTPVVAPFATPATMGDSAVVPAPVSAAVLSNLELNGESHSQKASQSNLWLENIWNALSNEY